MPSTSQRRVLTFPTATCLPCAFHWTGRAEEVAQKILQGNDPNTGHVTYGGGVEGTSAVQLLSHFRSPENEKLLKQMLSDSTEAWATSENTLTKTGYTITKTYLVRKYAFDVLKKWEIDVKQPTYSVELAGPKLAAEEQEVVWAMHEAGNYSLYFTEPDNDTFHLLRFDVRLPWKNVPDLTPLSKLSEVSTSGSGRGTRSVWHRFSKICDLFRCWSDET